MGGILTAGKADLTVGWPVLSNHWLIQLRHMSSAYWREPNKDTLCSKHCLQ